MSTEHSTINSWFIQYHSILHVITISQEWFHHMKKDFKNDHTIYLKAYPVYASTATIAFVPDGNSSIQYLPYVAVRTIGVWGVYRKSKTVEKVSSVFQQLAYHMLVCVSHNWAADNLGVTATKYICLYQNGLGSHSRDGGYLSNLAYFMLNFPYLVVILWSCHILDTGILHLVVHAQVQRGFHNSSKT